MKGIRFFSRILFVLAVAGLTTTSRAQTYTNFTVTLTANQLRDRFYDASTGAALMQNQIHAVVLHLMSEASSLNPGVLSASNSLAVMQNVIRDMTNAIGSDPFDYLKDLFTRLPAAKITQIREFTPRAWAKAKPQGAVVARAA